MKIKQRLGRWQSGFWVAACLLLTACQPNLSSPGLIVPVVRVTNGQELEVAGVAGRSEITERVRLEGMTAPALSQPPWGTTAQAYLEHLIDQKAVRLESDLEPRDQQGRRLAYVWRDNVLLNEQLVAAGYALVTPHSPNHKYDRRLANAQTAARTQGLGIWNPATPLRQLPPAP
jgi:micrococcal nuclease